MEQPVNIPVIGHIWEVKPQDKHMASDNHKTSKEKSPWKLSLEPVKNEQFSKNIRIIDRSNHR